MWGFQTRHPHAMTLRRAIGWALVTHFFSLRNCLHLRGPSACFTHFNAFNPCLRWCLTLAEQNVPAKACCQFGCQVVVARDLAVKVVGSRHLLLGLSLAICKIGIEMYFFPQSP